MANMSQLANGVKIQIRRTDGRLHSAIVSRVNNESKTVTVEWFENGETRGKDIEIEIVYALNKQFQPPNATAINLSRIPVKYSSKTSLPLINNIRNRLEPTHRRPSTLRRTVGADKITSAKMLNRASSANLSGMERRPSNLSSNILGKRQSVVKEIERIREQREERRQRLEKEKDEKIALMNSYPGDPNWQINVMIDICRNGLLMKPLDYSESPNDNLITVCVRKRPLNRRELAKKEIDVITVSQKDLITVHEPKLKVDLTRYLENQEFKFDYAFDETCNNELLYEYSAKPLVRTAFEGGMATCFAYGQTGSGKTYTMGGKMTTKGLDVRKGIYALAAIDIFQFLCSEQYRHLRLAVTASFFEIYSGEVFDLLSKKRKLRVMEDGKQQVHVVGLTEKAVNSVEEVSTLIKIGNQARTSGRTAANPNSSRSHAVFHFTLRSHGISQIHGKLSLIDLAGNERGADTASVDRVTRLEGAAINKSLLALKECIRALGRNGGHLPFRGSKLTQVLKDSFVGDNRKTCMIAMISPGMCSCEHSLNTLRYADRVKELPTNKDEDMRAEFEEDSTPLIENYASYENELSPNDNSQNDVDMSIEDEVYNNIPTQTEEKAPNDESEYELIDSLKKWRENCLKWDVHEIEILAGIKDHGPHKQALFELCSVLKERHISINQLIEKVNLLKNNKFK